ncbi:MAG: flagellar basal body P-ring formation chaperone FlgA [Candidatus Margulisbacteria bacterium]|nr:flagellar basal body P-ring formation chaperone FlgA [Candidatus Margulisiibacteriota bacterium]
MIIMRAVYVFALSFLILVSPSVALTDPEHIISEKIRSFVLAKHPAWAKDDIRITFKYPEDTFEKIAAYGDKAAVKIGQVSHLFRPAGSVIFPIEVKENNKTAKYLIRAKIEVFRKIVAASKTLRRKEIIAPDDITIEAKDIALLPEKYFYSVDDVLTREVKSSIPKRSVIFEWMIKKKPLLHRGEKVTILVISDKVKIETRGIAMDEGNMGDEISVKCDESKKTLKAKIVAADKVEVKL